MRALVTGATGFIGQKLLERLDRPVVLSRDPARAQQKLARFQVTAARWEPLEGPPPLEAFNGVDVVFNLAGEPVAEGRWNQWRKNLIRDSRVIGTQNLVAALCKLERRPKVLVSGSAVGYYGSRGDKELTETSVKGKDFLAGVCAEWEAAASEARELGMRVAMCRTGVVLGQHGALEKMLPPFRFGLGGPLGNGKQWMPWVHVDDIVGLLIHAASTDAVSGPMNGVAPRPVTNREFTAVLAKTLRRPAFLPVPYFGIRLAFGEVAEVLFASQRVLPRVAEQTGYAFRYPELRPALEEILHGDTSHAA